MNRVHTIALLLASGLALPGVTAQSLVRDVPHAAVVPTTLEQLRETPDAFKGVWVRFEIQFCSLGRISNPFFTEFDPSRFANFYAWSGEQEIWRKAEYDNVFGCLFVDKELPVVDELYDKKLYQRFVATGVVRNVFQDRPWIEVRQFEPCPGQVDTPTLAHLYRAEKHMVDRDWQKAISELSMAPSADKPRFLRTAVHKNLAVCYLRVGEATQARSHLEVANRLQTQPDRELTQLSQVAAENPQAALDQGVDKGAVGEADRPLWEAFEDSRPARPGR